MIPNKKTLIFDLDDTLCHSIKDSEKRNRNDTNELYQNPLPRTDIIKKLVEAKEKGYSIIIYSSRRMMTHKGNLNKIKEDVETITIDWLNRNNIPYDELIFGKPFGIFYIDDKAITPENFLKVDL